MSCGPACQLARRRFVQAVREMDKHLERIVVCECGWSGRSGALIAKHKLVCPKCGSDKIDYVIAPSTERRQ
jgi:hypothetical protein